MAASITGSPYTSAPGNTVTMNGSGLTAGAGASVVLQSQGPDGTLTTTISGATFTGSAVSFVVPDGARSGPVLVTASDLTTATATLIVNSQYLFASEYVGEGVDTSVLAAGELDRILQRASGYADAYIAQGSRETMTMRQLQCIEKAKWRDSRRIYPRRWPIVSLDLATYVVSNSLTIALDPTTFVINEDMGYMELVIWSFGWTYINQIASVTLVDAGIMKYTYTAGYAFGKYPQPLKEAVTMISTELLSQRNIQAAGMGGLSRFRGGTVQYDRRNETFKIPDPAKELLDSLRIMRAS